jgi:hypothetical protein
VRIKFQEWLKYYQTKNRIDVNSKMWILSGIEEALTILFPTSGID